MFQQKSIYVYIVTLTLLLMANDVAAQLITDSDARLKTVERKKVGFNERQQKKKQLGVTSTRAQFDQKKSSPRYSQPIVATGGIKRRYKSQESGLRFVVKGSASVFNTNSNSPYDGIRYKTAPKYSPAPSSIAKSEKVLPRYSQPANKGRIYVENPTRYSPGSPFSSKDYEVKPRYSPAPNSGKVFVVNPIRYSPGSPFSNKDFVVKPRYSSTPNAGRVYAVDPIRYSPGSPFSNKDFVVKPRYSSTPNAGRVYAVDPIRYSPGSPFSNNDYIVKPRYSPIPNAGRVYGIDPIRYSTSSPFSSKDYAVRPRYSPLPNAGRVYRVDPIRYSPGSPFKTSDYKVSPRYSPGSLYGGVVYLNERPRYSPKPAYDYYKITRPLSAKEPIYDLNDYKEKPRYSINSNFSLKRYWMLKHVPYGSMMYYKGSYSIKIDRPKDTHPSSAHLKAQYIASGFVEETMRNWSVKTGRITNGNNSQPDAVTQKVTKPKFDRKEREIWHN